jgi:hypothetical protein
MNKQENTPQVQSIEAMPEVLQTLLTTTADEVGIKSGLIKRQRKVKGSSYLQSTTLGWLVNPNQSLSELAQHMQRSGIGIKPQSMAQRFTQESVEFYRQMLTLGIGERFALQCEEASMFLGFRKVRIADSSIIEVPEDFVEQYPGCGNQNKKSASLKLQVNLELKTGEINLEVKEGKSSDHTSEVAFMTEAGELSIRDLGYYSFGALKRIEQAGGYFLTRVVVDQIFYSPQTGQRLGKHQYLEDGFDQVVALKSKTQSLEVRLVVLKVPEQVRLERIQRIKLEAKRRNKPVSNDALQLAGWDIRITNAPQGLLSSQAVFVVSRVRWQIELFFKLCKSMNLLDTSRSKNPFRVLSEIYAKLLGCLIQHWCLVFCAWEMPNRSLVKVARIIRVEAIKLFSILKSGSLQAIIDWLLEIKRLTQIGCTLDKRRKKPSSFQLLDGICA